VGPEVAVNTKRRFTRIAMTMKVKQFVVAIALTAAVLPHLVLPGSQTATYRVTFTPT
jgi:hypothetical protein